MTPSRAGRSGSARACEIRPRAALIGGVRSETLHHRLYQEDGRNVL